MSTINYSDSELIDYLESLQRKHAETSFHQGPDGRVVFVPDLMDADFDAPTPTPGVFTGETLREAIVKAIS